MKAYNGHSKSDPFSPGGFGYFKTHEGAPGHEEWNFAARGGHVLGYVPRSCGIQLERLGANRKQPVLHGVLVVFVARDPASNVLKVVGWFQNATVARTAVFRRTYGRIRIEAPIRALFTDAHVLNVALRNLVVPKAPRDKGGVGQSPVWYGESFPELRAQILALVRQQQSASKKNPPSKTRKSGGGSGAGWNSDPESRAQIEQAAMSLALRYFDRSRDVSKHCRGWDVEIETAGRLLRIEVKGLFGKELRIELTPNEYQKMRAWKADYILFVVTEALSTPRVRVFRWKTGYHWWSDSNEKLLLQPKTGATGRL
jgi:hypothetical protein